MWLTPGSVTHRNDQWEILYELLFFLVVTHEQSIESVTFLLDAPVFGTASGKPQWHHKAIQATCTMGSRDTAFLGCSHSPSSYTPTAGMIQNQHRNAASNESETCQEKKKNGVTWQLLEEPRFYPHSWRLTITPHMLQSAAEKRHLYTFAVWSKCVF